MNSTVNQNYAGRLSICPSVLSGSEEVDTEPFRQPVKSLRDVNMSAFIEVALYHMHG